MNASTFVARREFLRNSVKGGAILFLGQSHSPRTYLANPYPFRQSSHFLYYLGTSQPNLAAVILPDGEPFMFGPPLTPDDLVWHGPQASLADYAAEAGIQKHRDISTLEDFISGLQAKGTEIHYLPPFRGDQTLSLATVLGMPASEVGANASQALARAIVEQRSIKTKEEVAEIENALTITARMHTTAMAITQPGLREAEVAGAIQGVALSHDRAQAFLPIVSIRSEVLHNESYQNIMQEGDLLIIDAGAESPHFYASDITRTIPVKGRYTQDQKAIYQIVLNAQLAVIDAASPKVSNRDLHLIAARTITSGLKDIGLMKGDVEEAVSKGAHALFFCHGIGHMLGLDTHDMEDLGDVVGYPEDQKRSKQFGLSFLRLAKKLKPGFVITDEPGIYFIPSLIDRWTKEKKHQAFIDYAALDHYRSFGGIRIEDDLLITETGCRVLGPGIPKTINEVEGVMGC